MFYFLAGCFKFPAKCAKSGAILLQASAWIFAGLILVFPASDCFAQNTGTEESEHSTGIDEQGEIQWIHLERGLDFCDIKPRDGSTKITVLRIDPKEFDFVLESIGQDDSNPKTLGQWAARGNLTAAINASMYLPDGKTSTGYMRDGEYINNPRMVERFGAFFVANPKETDLPNAQILDKDMPDWREQLDKYDIVVQNYRMTNARRRILWSPGGPLYSISAMAQTGDGKILFLHSRAPVEAYSFVQQLLHLPLDIRTIIYAEGGAQAGLVINSPILKRDLATPHAPSLFITGNLKAVLPNIIGIKPKIARQPNQKE